MRRATLLVSVVLMMAAVVRAQQAATTKPAGALQHQVDPAIQQLLTQAKPADSDDPLRQKQKEYHNTAVQLLQWRIDAYRNGVGDVNAVFEAARDVAQAKLALAQSETERAGVLEQVLSITKSVEANLERQWKAGLGAEGPLLRARLAREAAEIELLKQKNTKTTGPTTRPQ